MSRRTRTLPHNWRTLFPKSPAVIGMVHVRALPGTPAFLEGGGDPEEIVQTAIKEAAIYRDAGLDGILIENIHDTPYLKTSSVGPEITSWMTRIGRAVKEEVGSSMPCGMQILAGANKQALAAAHAAGLNFVRVEGFVFGHVADEGWIEACAGELLRYRRQIGAEHVMILADIKKKHSAHAVTADVDLVETGKAAVLFRADGVIVTGKATGDPTDSDELLQLVGSASKETGAAGESEAGIEFPLPVLVGSGVALENCDDYKEADGWIVGSWFKQRGHWANELDVHRVKALMEKASAMQR